MVVAGVVALFLDLDNRSARQKSLWRGGHGANVLWIPLWCFGFAWLGLGLGRLVGMPSPTGDWVIGGVVITVILTLYIRAQRREARAEEKVADGTGRQDETGAWLAGRAEAAETSVALADGRVAWLCRRATPAMHLVVGFFAPYFAAQMAARTCYDEFWPGVPDGFRAEMALLPELAFRHNEGYFWQDAQQAAIFGFAAAAFGGPPLAGGLLGWGTGRRLGAWGLTLLSMNAALYEIWRRWDSYVHLFFPRDCGIDAAWRCGRNDAAWVVGLSLGGLLVGQGLLLLRRRPSKAVCSRCGCDVRVQRELGLARCPECGAEGTGEAR